MSLLFSVLNRFQRLIVREWLWGGHPFSQRNKKLGVSVARYKGQGSVFLLFLDAVHQVGVFSNYFTLISSDFFNYFKTINSAS